MTYLLATHGELTSTEIQNVTGMTNPGVHYMMANIDRAGVPLYKPRRGWWALLPPFGRGSPIGEDENE